MEQPDLCIRVYQTEFNDDMLTGADTQRMQASLIESCHQPNAYLNKANN